MRERAWGLNSCLVVEFLLSSNRDEYMAEAKIFVCVVLVEIGSKSQRQ